MTAVLERQTVKAIPSGAALSADITGVDLSSELTADVVGAIEAAWSQHLVLRFRGQRLNDDQLMCFTSRLGELDHAPIPAAKVKVAGEDRFVEIGAETRRYVNVVSNVIENGRAIGSFGSGEVAWHTDMSYNPEPPNGSALYAIEVPPSGGDKMFANMYAAYERLDGALRARIAGRRCHHDASRNSAGELRRGFAEIHDPRQIVGASHPSFARIRVAAQPRLNRGTGAGRKRGVARSALATRHAARADLDSDLEGRRPRALGQSMHHPPARLL